MTPLVVKPDPTSLPPSGAASGILAGSYPNPTLAPFLVTNGTGLHVNIAAGYIGGALIAAQAAVSIADASTNYVELTIAGVATVNTSGFTSGNIPLATVVTVSGAITTNTDNRAWIQEKGLPIAYVGYQTLTDASTVAFNVALGPNAVLTIAGDRTLGAPSNLIAGSSGIIKIIQAAGGSHTLAYNAVWKFAGGSAPVLSTAAGAVDLLCWFTDGTNCYANLTNAYS